MKNIFNWIKYSGCNITLKLNPFDWNLHFKYHKTVEVWEVNSLVISFLPITVRIWFHDGSW